MNTVHNPAGRDRPAPRPSGREFRQMLAWQLLIGWMVLWPHPSFAQRGELELRVVDAQTREPLAVQLQLFSQRGRSIKPSGLVRDGDWLVFDGQAVLALPPGTYSFRIRRGLEYRERTGEFQMRSGAADNQTVDLPRFVNMAEEGWWSGDLQFQPASLANLASRLLASDLHLVPIISLDAQGDLQWSNNAAQQLSAGIGSQRFIQTTVASDRRDGGVTILAMSGELPSLPAPNDALPSPFDVARQVRQSAAADGLPHVHLTHVCARDLPTWVGLGQLDSVGLLHDGLRAESSQDTAEDQPRDRLLFPDPDGVGRWSQQTYFRLLEAGIRLPPGAGSGADGSGNVLGYARAYVYCGDRFSPAAWWEGLRAGRVVVSNGPLLRPRVNGQLPGHVFRGAAGEELALEFELQLSTQDKIRYLEIIQNGRSVQQVRLEDWVGQGGRLPPVICRESGWLLVRAIAEHPSAYRGAISGPFYVEVGDRPRISREACQYFLDWLYDRARHLTAATPQERRQILTQHRTARDFWQQQLSAATTE